MKQSVEMTKKARVLRRRSTDAEARLWRALRGRRFNGWKFRRQVPVAGFIADFLYKTEKLIIEVDGGHHALVAKKDTERTRALEAEGYRVIRFWNNDVMGNLEGVLTQIQIELESCPSPLRERVG